MKYLILTQHTNYCEIQQEKARKQHVLADHCKGGFSYFLFFGWTDFYLVRYYRCMEIGGKYNFFEDIVKQLFKEVEVFESHEVCRRNIGTIEKFKKDRLLSISVETSILQINHLYLAFNKPYAIVTKFNYIEAICNNDILTSNYNLAKKTLKDNDLDYLQSELFALYEANYIGGIDDIEILKSVDALIKTINKSKNEINKNV